MQLLYSLSIYIYGLLIRLAALFNDKAKLFIQGRKNILQRLERDLEGVKQRPIWFHTASLGEFEQGRPLIEGLKKEQPKIRIILTFFSPSGFEIRKYYDQADHIYYLPMDSPSNAKKFISIVNPAIAVFVKYEFWHNYIKAMYSAGIPCISVASIFREDQAFFKWYGGFFRETLLMMEYLFVQNQESHHLLKKIGVHRVKVVGDTRFDRVKQIAGQKKDLDEFKDFSTGQDLIVAGSVWEEDIEVMADYVAESQAKFIIAPHEVHDSQLTWIEKRLNVHSIRYSQLTNNSPGTEKVIVIDNMGMLSSLYSLGKIAYVGGAFGKGLHNILEAVVYGIPVIFGNKKYQKFQEARDLIKSGGAFVVSGAKEFNQVTSTLLTNRDLYKKSSMASTNYIKSNLGASEEIISYITQRLKNESKSL